MAPGATVRPAETAAGAAATPPPPLPAAAPQHNGKLSKDDSQRRHQKAQQQVNLIFKTDCFEEGKIYIFSKFLLLPILSPCWNRCVPYP